MITSGAARIEVVKALLEARANVNAANKRGGTALMIASGADRIETVKALLEANADVNTRDEKGETGLSFAVEGFFNSRYPEREAVAIARTLLQHGAFPDPDYNGLPLIVSVIRRGARDLAQLLIEKGTDPNIRIQGDNTLLMEAVANGGPAEVVKLLVSKGADVNLKGKGDQTALSIALKSNRADLAQILVAAGAK
jgi:ankyrin repeat protein